MAGVGFLWCPVGECVPSDSLLPIVLTSVPAIACDNSLVVLCYLLACHLWLKFLVVVCCRFSVAGVGGA